MTTVDDETDSLLIAVRDAGVAPGAIALWYTGGAGYIVKTAGATVLMDPFLAPSTGSEWIRGIPPAFDAARIGDLGRFDALLITHEHGDHADPVALAPLGPLTTVYGPAACIAVARQAGVPDENCRVLAHDDSVTFGDLTVTAVPMNDPGAPGCNGYVLETSSVAVLMCGDSIYSDGFVPIGQRWKLDAICLSVGHNPPGQTIYLDESGAARATRDANARILIPQHFDLWQGLTLDPHRVEIVNSWYCPETRVLPALFRERLDIEPV